MTGGAQELVPPGRKHCLYITRLIPDPSFFDIMTAHTRIRRCAVAFKVNNMAKQNISKNISDKQVNAEFELPGDWWTVPAVSEDGRDIVMVTGRRDIAKFRDNPRYNIHVDISWKYADAGMPDAETSRLMEEVTVRLAREFKKDPVAVLTGIYTGAGQRDWSLYTLSLPIFGRKLNEMLADLPLLPLKIDADADAEWIEYAEMSRVHAGLADDDDAEDPADDAIVDGNVDATADDVVTDDDVTDIEL